MGAEKHQLKQDAFAADKANLPPPSGGGAQCAPWAERALSVTANAEPPSPVGRRFPIIVPSTKKRTADGRPYGTGCTKHAAQSLLLEEKVARQRRVG